MDLSLYTNRSVHNDFIFNAFNNFTRSPCNIYIAVAFFTESQLLKDIAIRDCPIRIVIRLGHPTCPKALKEILDTKGIQVRYVTDRSFHPKLYLFGDNIALVGSANLTNAGTRTNQEIMLTVPSDDQRFEELSNLFSEYWSQAKVLTPEILDVYSRLCDKYSAIDRQAENLKNDIIKKIGRVAISNIRRGLPKPNKENLFIDDFRRTYQQFIEAYDVIKDVYVSFGKRKHTDDEIPLRLEIDSFVSFVRERHAQKNKWQETPIITGEEQRNMIRELVKDWHKTYWIHFEEVIVQETYPRLKNIFSNPESIRNADDETLIDGLSVLHSFHDRLRFFKGGFQTLAAKFIEKNDTKKIRESLVYLLFGKDNIEVRMANLIYDPGFSLSEFGRSNVQELIGWSNNQNLPVVNGRTTKILRYFGFDVIQL